MATTNLISKSLGGVLQESGEGSPNHISPLGSTYVDRNTAVLYVNTDGGSSWSDTNKISYGNMYVTSNTTAVTPVVTNTWYSLSGATWTGSSNNGITFSAGTDVLVLNNGRDGKYLIIGNGRINRQTANALYQIGISKNNETPDNGYYHNSSTSANETTSSITVIGMLNLVGGDTVQLTARNITTTNNILVSESSLTLLKIGNT